MIFDGVLIQRSRAFLDSRGAFSQPRESMRNTARAWEGARVLIPTVASGVIHSARALEERRLDLRRLFRFDRCIHQNPLRFVNASPLTTPQPGSSPKNGGRS
jgi:hypothetical protein